MSAPSSLLRLPPDPGFDTEGAGDEDAGIFGLDFSESDANVVLLPVPWEPTTSYGEGAAMGPSLIAEASPQLDLFDPRLAPHGLSRPWRWGIAMRESDPDILAWNDHACDSARPIVAAGGRIEGNRELTEKLQLVNTYSRWLNARVRESAADILARGKILGVVGGDHSAPFGAIAAAAEHHGALTILHVDAHADLRVAYEGFEHSHASIMHNVLTEISAVERIVQVGIRDLSQGEWERTQTDPRLHTVFDHQISDALERRGSWSEIVERALARLGPKVWISFDIDGLDPVLCPGTGTPVPGGLSFSMTATLIEQVALRGAQIVGFDLCEVAPSSAAPEWDGNVGARILYRLCAAALYSHGARD